MNDNLYVSVENERTRCWFDLLGLFKKIAKTNSDAVFDTACNAKCPEVRIAALHSVFEICDTNKLLQNLKYLDSFWVLFTYHGVPLPSNILSYLLNTNREIEFTQDEMDIIRKQMNSEVIRFNNKIGHFETFEELEKHRQEIIETIHGNNKVCISLFYLLTIKQVVDLFHAYGRDQNQEPPSYKDEFFILDKISRYFKEPMEIKKA
jgi:hypothetical protein